MIKYKGECGSCKTKFTATIDTSRSEPFPDTFIMECPLPWCGTIKMEKHI